MAVARTVELGSLDLVSTTTGLQLHFSSVLHFASFGKDDIDSPKLTLESLTSDTLLRPFVRAADRFKLVLSLRFSVELNSASEDELLGKFSAAIEKAELWAQLQLSPISVKTSANEDTSLRFLIITLEYVRGSREGTRKPIHKLEADVPFHDIRPPSGVENLVLETVHLSMHISQHSPRKQRKFNRQQSDPSISATNDFHRLDFTELDSQCDLLPIDGTDLVSWNSARASNVMGEWSIRFGLTSPSTSSLPSPIRRGNGGSGRAFPDSPPARSVDWPLKRTSSSADLQAKQCELVDTSAVLELLRVGFRESISKQSQRRRSGIHFGANASLVRLAEVAPTLWCPGYLAKVSGRTVFLPTISHALARVGKRSANSSLLRSKMDRLLGVESSATSTAGHDRAVQATIAAKLFYILQKGLLNPRAAKQLKPLPTIPDHLASAFEYTGMMLNAGQDSQIYDEGDCHHDIDDLYNTADDLDDLSLFEEDGLHEWPPEAAGDMPSRARSEDDEWLFDQGRAHTYPYPPAPMFAWLDDEHDDDDWSSACDSLRSADMQEETCLPLEHNFLGGLFVNSGGGDWAANVGNEDMLAL